MRKVLLALLLILTAAVGVVELNLSSRKELWLSPLPGDNYPQLQQAINYCIANPQYSLHLQPGVYNISRTLLILSRAGNDYGQVFIDLEGAHSAFNTVQTYCSIIHATFTDAPAIVIQQGKGCILSNLIIEGGYLFPNALSQLQVDTLTKSQWLSPTTLCSTGRTNPYTAIAIDPFDDPVFHSDSLTNPFYAPLRAFYLPGMQRNGSTALTISNLTIDDFVVGIMITPSMCYNGELIDVHHVVIDYCYAAYAYSQAQSKANTLTHLMCWGNTHTVLDGVDFGFSRGDGATPPFCDVWNVAGYNYQLLECYLSSYALTMQRIYVEEVFKIGLCYGTTLVHFIDWQVDFQQADPTTPTPDWYCFGQNICWDNCLLKVYRGSTPFRLQFTNPGDLFLNCTFSDPPITKIVGASVSNPRLLNNHLYYAAGAGLPWALSDSGARDQWTQYPIDTLHIDRSTFTGWWITPAAVFAGDVLSNSVNNILGVIDSTHEDTAFLSHMGVGVYPGQNQQIFVNHLN